MSVPLSKESRKLEQIEDILMEAAPQLIQVLKMLSDFRWKNKETMSEDVKAYLEEAYQNISLASRAALETTNKVANANWQIFQRDLQQMKTNKKKVWMFLDSTSVLASSDQVHSLYEKGYRLGKKKKVVK